jgi:hypothetical protein
MFNCLSLFALQDLMRRALTYEDSVRWGRCLTEIAKIASTICPASAAEAYTEIVNRLHVRLPAIPARPAQLLHWGYVSLRNCVACIRVLAQ